MKWEELLNLVGSEPVFASAILKVGNVAAEEIQMQLIRWVKAGKIIQLRRGLYALAEPYQKVTPHPFLVANQLKKASYISLQSALAHYGMIPEYVPAVTSVTTGRPEQLRTKLGVYIFRHIKKTFFKGFREIEVAPAQFAFVAAPEKAILDLIYLTPRGDTKGYLSELRLQNLDKMNLSLLVDTAKESRSPKLLRAARRIMRMAKKEGYEGL